MPMFCPGPLAKSLSVRVVNKNRKNASASFGCGAPATIPASRVVSGKVVRTRPLCPYPQVARYKGTGSTDEAANFSCAAP